MHCYVEVKKHDKEIHVIGIADNVEVIRVSEMANEKWKVIQSKEIMDDLSEALCITKLFNEVMIKAEKQRLAKEPKKIDFLIENGSLTLFEELLHEEIHYLDTLDNMLIGEVLSTLFKDSKGRIFEVTYSFMTDSSYLRTPNIQEWKEI